MYTKSLDVHIFIQKCDNYTFYDNVKYRYIIRDIFDKIEEKDAK